MIRKSYLRLLRKLIQVDFHEYFNMHILQDVKNNMILIAIFAMMVSIWIILIFILIKVYEIDAEIRSNRIMERWRDELE